MEFMQDILGNDYKKYKNFFILLKNKENNKKL